MKSTNTNRDLMQAFLRGTIANNSTGTLDIRAQNGTLVLFTYGTPLAVFDTQTIAVAAAPKTKTSIGHRNALVKVIKETGKQVKLVTSDQMNKMIDWDDSTPRTWPGMKRKSPMNVIHGPTLIPTWNDTVETIPYDVVTYE